jgi:hypothetical protein
MKFHFMKKTGNSLEVDPKLRVNISQRLMRLFGLRIEPIPFLEKEMIELIEGVRLTLRLEYGLAH